MVSSYILLGFHQLQQFACLENLLYRLLILVGVLAPRRNDDGTDFGCILIQSNGVIAQLEIKGCVFFWVTPPVSHTYHTHNLQHT